MFKKIRTVVAVACLTVAAFAVAQERPDTYVVKKGDTLWGISARFLSKPWLWPEIWQANPQIANPHLIYPGDVISLAYLDRVAVAPGPRTEAPLTGVPLKDVQPFLRDLRVVDSFEELPYVAGLQEDRLRSFGGLQIYALGLDETQVGQRYAVLRPHRLYRLPRPNQDLDQDNRPIIADGGLWRDMVVPDERSEFLGYELEQMGVGTVTAVGASGEPSTLKMEANGREIRKGDRLVPVTPQPYDLQFFPHAPAQALAEGQVRVLSIADADIYGGPHSVVALSGGSADGLDNGTVLSIWRPGSYVLDPTRGGSTSRMTETKKHGAGRNHMPDEYAAHVMIFRTFDKVSYGLIMEGSQPVRVGYFTGDPNAGPQPAKRETAAR